MVFDDHIDDRLAGGTALPANRGESIGCYVDVRDIPAVNRMPARRTDPWGPVRRHLVSSEEQPLDTPYHPHGIAVACRCE